MRAVREPRGSPEPRAAAIPAATALFLALVPAEAAALEWDAILTQRAFNQSIPEDVLYSALRVTTATRSAARTTYQLHAAALLEGRPTEVLGLRLGLDTGLIELGGERPLADGRPLGEQARRTLFLGETFGSLQLGPNGVLELRAGKLRPNLGHGAVFHAYAFGLDVDLDLGLLDPSSDDASPWSFHAGIFLPDATFTAEQKESPLAELEVAYRFLRRSEVRLFAALFADGEDGLAPVIADAVFRGRVYQAAEAAELGLRARDPERLRALGRAFSAAYDAGLIGYSVQTGGLVSWLGLSGRLEQEPLVVSAQVITSFGRLDTTVTPNAGLVAAVAAIPEPARRAAFAAFLLAEGPETVSLQAVFGDLRAELTLGDLAAVDGFILGMSGDRGFSRRTTGGSGSYGAFLSLAPLVPETQVFFNGGVSQNLASPVAASIAPDGAGLLAAGAGASVTPWAWLYARASVALMSSTVESVLTRSRALGVELDLELRVEAHEALLLTADAGLYLPGAYFGDLPLGHQVILGASFFPAQL